MAKIRIVHVPEGEAPEQFRSAWVGLILPCQCVTYGAEYGNTSMAPTSDRPHFQVPARRAIEALEKVDPEAAFWFTTKLGERIDHEFLCFGLNEAVLL